MKRTTASVFCLLLMAFAATSEAQEPVATFGELNSRLRIGDKVWVIDAQGRERHGRLTGLQDASLTLNDGAPTTLGANVVREVRRQRRDSLLNGLLIGFAVGAVIGQVGGGRKCGSDPECLLYPGTYGVTVSTTIASPSRYRVSVRMYGPSRPSDVIVVMSRCEEANVIPYLHI